jgi:hypothetical protein
MKTPPIALTVLLLLGLASCKKPSSPGAHDMEPNPPSAGSSNTDSGGNVTSPTIAEQIDAAVAAGARQVKIQPGTYHASSALSLNNLSGLDIDATGATLILSKLTTALRISGCSDLTIRGLTIDYDPLPMTQGTIVGFGPNREWTDVKIHQGYPDPTFLADGWAFIWTSDKTTRLHKPGTGNRANKSITSQGDGVWRIAHGGPMNDTAEIGDFLRIPQKVESHGAIGVRLCTNLTLIGVTVFSAPYHFGTEFRWCHGVTLRSCRIVPGPPPSGATEARLFSAVGDGFNFRGITGGLRIEDCETDSTGDDGIPVYYSPIMVLENVGQKVTLSSENPGRPLFQAGARLRFFVSKTGKIEEATVKSCTRSSFAPSEMEKIRKQVIDSQFAHQFMDPMEVELDSPVNAQPGDEALLLDECASETIIRGCRVRNAGSRGIVANRSNIRVEDNHVEHSFFPGIHVFAFFRREGGPGFQENVRISANQITRANIGHSANPDFLGGISVVRWDKRELQFGGHRNIVIEDNQISRNWGVDLQVQAATGVVIRGNRFIESHLEKWTGDQPLHRAVIFLQNVADATLEGNEVVNPGPEIGEELLVTDQVQNLRADRPFTDKPGSGD